MYPIRGFAKRMINAITKAYIAMDSINAIPTKRVLII
jgi:hypothetical protein